MEKSVTKRNHLRLILIVAVFLMLVPARNGYAAATGFVKENGRTYYYTESGEKYSGWLTLAGNKYYFYKGSGIMATGWVSNAQGEKRYFDPDNGIMLQGWYTMNGNKYYFYKGSGVMATGWVSNSAGQWRYFDPNTGIMTKGWKTLDGNKYYFYSGNGVMATGWVSNSAGEKRYFNPNTGIMTKGWLTLNGNQYYFYTGNGVMATGWVKNSSGKYRYFDKETGIMSIGLKTIDGDLYYLDPNGFMITNKTMTIDGTSYSFDANGKGTVNTPQGSVFLSELMPKLESMLPKTNGTWSVYVADLKDGTSASINTHSSPSASVLKMYIMATAYENYATIIRNYDKDMVDDRIEQMVSYSNNVAADQVLRYIGRGDLYTGTAIVTAYCQNHGYPSTRIAGGFTTGGPTTMYTTVEDCGKFLTDIYEAASGKKDIPYASKMYQLLKNQHVRYKIPAKMPSYVTIANKTGELLSGNIVSNDVAIITDPSKGLELVVCFMSHNLSSFESANSSIAAMSRFIYDSY